jgi:hypothetical protein
MREKNYSENNIKEGLKKAFALKDDQITTLLKEMHSKS